MGVNIGYKYTIWCISYCYTISIVQWCELEFLKDINFSTPASLQPPFLVLSCYPGGVDWVRQSVITLLLQ